MTQLAGKTVLITGATGGFGHEFSRQLFKKGNRLILTDLDYEILQRQAGEIEAGDGSGQIIRVIAADLSSHEGVRLLYDEVNSLGEPLDVLINNAGVALLGRHDEVPVDMWERLIDVNLLAPMRLCSLFLRQMIERRNGHIVNVASVTAWSADIGLTAYAASKSGLRGFSETLTKEISRYNVRVSTVYPFYSRTPLLESPQYGSFALDASFEELIPSITDPASVIAATIAGIEKNEPHIFPDRVGRTFYRLKRYLPWFFHRVSKRMSLANHLVWDEAHAGR